MAELVKDIKYEGDNTTFVWKSPIEDFNTGSVLTVREAQEAIFFMNGQALDLFGPGRHVLETQNMPVIHKFLNKASDEKTTYHCDVYFINKTDQTEVRWGTDTQVEYTDPQYNIPLKIGASGTMVLRAEDSRKLLVKLVGTEGYLNQAQLAAKFRSFLMVRVKPYLGQMLRTGQFSIFDVDSKSEEFSEALQQKLVADFSEYGMNLVRFFVTTFAKPDGDPRYEKIKDLRGRQGVDILDAQLRQQVTLIDQQTEAQQIVIEAQALAAKRQIEGFTYQQEQSFEVSKLAAQNEGSGNFSSAGIGLGMMGGIAGGMGATIAGITTNAMAPAAPQASAPAPVDPMADLKLKIEKLKLMKESGLLNDEEFEAERKKLLSAL